MAFEMGVAAAAASELPAWLAASSGGRPQPTRLAPQRVAGRGGGWGAVAEEAVARGTPLVSVPLSAMMTVGTARESKRYGRLSISSADEGLSDWQALSVHLLSERAAGDDSRWSPYLQMLPDQKEHPLLWPEECRAALLAGSPMKGRLESRLRMVDEDREAILSAGGSPILQNAEATGLSLRWAAATLLSRSFYLDLDGEDDVDVAEEDGQFADDQGLMAESWEAGGEGMDDSEGPAGAYNQLALVPWADLLNHSSAADHNGSKTGGISFSASSGSQSVLAFDKDSQCAVLRAHRDYKAGEEVFDSYGPSLSPSELLLDYGFVDAENQNHQVQLGWEALADTRSDMNVELLRSVEALFGGVSIVLSDSDGIDATSLACLRAASVTGEQLKEFGISPRQLGDPSGAMATMAYLSSPVSAAHERIVIEEALTRLEALEGQYSALPSVQDIAGLFEGVDAAWILQQVEMARASELNALRGTVSQLSRAAERLKEGSPLDKLYV